MLSLHVLPVSLRVVCCVSAITQRQKTPSGKKKKKKICLYKVIFKRNPFYMDTLETTENNVVPMLGLVWRYSLKEEKEEDEDLIFILKNNI